MTMVDTKARESERLVAARDRFGPDVTLSEPFAPHPPLWIEPRSPALREDVAAAVGWMDEHHEAIEQALLTFGAIVWRGFPVAGPEDFERLMGRFEPFSRGYVGGTSDRKTISGKVMESTRTPPDFAIFLHQEMSYMTVVPRALAFYCNRAPETGGETVICDMRGVLEALPEDLRAKFLQYDVDYVRHMRSEREGDWRANPDFQHPSWQYRFETDDRAVVEAQLKERGARYEWFDDGGLSLWTRVPTTRTHPVTGDLLYFNQMHVQVQNRITVGEERAAILDEVYKNSQRPYSTRFSNGEPLSDEEFQTVHDVFEARKVAFRWQEGDIMLLENRLTGHGREKFSGDRDIQVMLFE